MALPRLAFDDLLLERVRAHLGAFDRRAVHVEGRRPAAVAMVLLADDDGEACFVLTRRSAGLRAHARQWALPGGRIDEGETAEEAARRELEEELGVTLGPESVIGALDDYGTRSGFVITPVVLWGAGAGALQPNPDEVATVHRVPLLDLPEPRFITIPESDRPVIQVPLLGALVHAPTAAVLYQTREVLVHGRPTRVDHFEQPVFAWK